MDDTDLRAENRAWRWKWKVLNLRARLAYWIIGDMPFAANITMTYVKATGPGFFFNTRIQTGPQPPLTYTPAPITPAKSGVRIRMHPDDTQRISQTMWNAMAGKE